MAWELLFWFLCLCTNFGLLAMLFYELLCLTDLEADQLNPFEATACINKWILPEFILQGVICVLLLLTGHWVIFLMEAPLTCYHVLLFMKREHLIDITEVFRNLNSEKKYRFIKLGIYLFFFALFMFRITLIAFLFIRNEDDEW
ncbi:protein cornichon homolog 1 isoform X2 [Jatropha curcas]|uniref:protein cornichon homolog 1 isoform X2 n=1 Tax=Jatropha curcas TaxID=180498 RepID=UPI0005FB6053|nr:protein cornichon homolog 1 isoform X2 [Jatropha curcas]